MNAIMNQEESRKAGETHLQIQIKQEIPAELTDEGSAEDVNPRNNTSQVTEPDQMTTTENSVNETEPLDFSAETETDIDYMKQVKPTEQYRPSSSQDKVTAGEMFLNSICTPRLVLTNQGLQSLGCNEIMKPYSHPKSVDKTPQISEHKGKDNTTKSDVSPKMLQLRQKNTNKGQVSYECCGKMFTQKCTYTAHIKIHSGERPFKCTLCEKTFISSAHLKSHTVVHIRDRPYTCYQCEKTFMRASELKVHGRIHSGERPYTCDICDKGFVKKSQLVVHMRSHTGERPFKCSHCDKAFSNTSHLKLHTRTHTGDRPYKCEHCDKAFTQSSSLKIHSRTHTGDKPYICDICDKTFALKAHLSTHIMSHTGEKPHQCLLCDKAFSTSSNLRMHEKTHTGDKPYRCIECDKTFIRSTDLRRHISTHSLDKPYQCFQCDKAFSVKRYLVKHIKNHSFLNKPSDNNISNHETEQPMETQIISNNQSEEAYNNDPDIKTAQETDETKYHDSSNDCTDEIKYHDSSNECNEALENSPDTEYEHGLHTDCKVLIPVNNYQRADNILNIKTEPDMDNNS